MANVTLDSITKIFDDSSDEIVAVDDLSIEVDDGEFLVLVGPSGCGKSTTLRMIAGLETPTSGEIFISDRMVNNVQPYDRNIAMVFQNYALYPHKTVRGNLEFGLKMSTDLSKDERKKRVQETAELLEIEELLGQRPRQLSGGQAQRAALGRAIIRDPEVFLFDEPLSNLDAKLRTTMRTEIQRIQNELGTTSIYVTHDQEEAMTMGDRIAILEGGQLQQIGTPSEVFHRPVNRFVAGFIGNPSMNFVAGRLEGNTERPRFSGDGIDFTLPEEFGSILESHLETELTLGIRPEHFSYLVGDSEGPSLSTTVEVLEPMGTDNYVHFRVGEIECTARISDDYPITTGESIRLGFSTEHVHFFDPVNGTTISHGRTIHRDAEAEPQQSLS